MVVLNLVSMVVSGYLHGMRAPTKFSMGTFVRRGHDDQDSEVYLGTMLHGTRVLNLVQGRCARKGHLRKRGLL